MTSGVEVTPAVSAAEMERFIRVPMRLNAGDPNWIAPLIMERSEALSPKHNPLFTHAEAAFWIARRDGRDVGRISAQIDRLAPADERGAFGYFGMIAAEDDPAIFAALFGQAEAWLKARGCSSARGPFNLSINEEIGLLVDGFDTPPMLMMGHDPAYAGARVEEQGYAKLKDVFAYICDTATDIPKAARARIERSENFERIALRRMDMAQYDKQVRDLTEIFNDAWAGNWGFTPLTAEETDHLGKSLKLILNKDLVWFADIDGEPAGFGVCLPNLNEAIRDVGGKLLPFGLIKLLWRLKVSGVKSGRVPLMGVKRKFMTGGSVIGAMVPFMIIDAMRREARRLGMDRVEMSWILEDNRPMRRIIETVGGERYKTYRIYEKALT